MRQRYIEQATIFNTIGMPQGYDTLTGWQRHNIRQTARITYDTQRDAERGHKWAASIAFEDAKALASYYTAQNIRNERERRCGAKAKTTQGPCRMKPIKGRKRCKYHGGLSTGPRTIEGKIKALLGLIQYKRRPELLETRIERLMTEWLESPEYAPQGYEIGEALPSDL